MFPDKVFGPATTTRQVYDVAAQHVVNGAMEGINGTPLSEVLVTYICSRPLCPIQISLEFFS